MRIRNMSQARILKFILQAVIWGLLGSPGKSPDGALLQEKQQQLGPLCKLGELSSLAKHVNMADITQWRHQATSQATT